MIFGFSNILRNSTPYYYVDLPSFQRDFASVKTLDHGTGPAITFTRASGATYFDVNGVLQTAGNDVARFDHSQDGAASSLGLLIEESRTNSLRNSQAGGAVVGASGTMPTNWGTFESGGISREVVGVGTANGLNYIDIKFSGTDTGSGSSIAINLDSITQVVATTGQSWSAFAYIALVGGTFSGASSPAFRLVERTAAGTAISGAITSISINSAGATLSKFEVSRTMAGAGVERVMSQVSINVTASATIDFTLRIAAPQLELGAFPTSYIPTTSAAASRATEVANVESPNFAGAYNNAEGTLFGEYIFGNSAPSIRMLQIDNTTSDERLCLALTSISTPQNFGQTGGVSTLASSPATGAITVGAIYKTAAAFAANNMIAASNGTLGPLDSSGAMPVGPLGRVQVSGNTARGHWIRKVAYWPKRLSNTLLEQITT